MGGFKVEDIVAKMSVDESSVHPKNGMVLPSTSISGFSVHSDFNFIRSKLENVPRS